jgi:hypothetical protein
MRKKVREVWLKGNDPPGSGEIVAGDLARLPGPDVDAFGEQAGGHGPGNPRLGLGAAGERANWRALLGGQAFQHRGGEDALGRAVLADKDHGSCRSHAEVKCNLGYHIQVPVGAARLPPAQGAVHPTDRAVAQAAPPGRRPAPDGLIALPLDARTREQLEWLAEEVTDAGGQAAIWLAEPATAAQERALAQRMAAAVAADYRAVAAATVAARSQPSGPRRRTVGRLRRELRRIGLRDHSPHPNASRPTRP